MEISIECTSWNFNGPSKILNIKHNALVKKVGNLESTEDKICRIELLEDIYTKHSNALNLCVRIHIDKARAFYYNKRVCVILQSLIHEKIGLVYDCPLSLVELDIITWAIYNHTFAKPWMFEDRISYC